jgi:hypothetical protein
MPKATLDDVHSIDPILIHALKSYLPLDQVQRIMGVRQKSFSAVGAYENVYGDTSTSVPKSSMDVPEK